MINKLFVIPTKREQIFQQGSRTYFYASRIFPDKTKREVAILYAFVRTADNYVDSIPPAKESFLNFKKEFNNVWQGQISDNWIITDFVKLAKKKEISKDWIDAFLKAMESDLNSQPCKNLAETESYIYGSAEVVGLMMAKIMNLSPESYQGARLLGKAMQYINFIRDIKEDEGLGRQYLPLTEIEAFGLNNLSSQEIKAKPENFKHFIKKQLGRYLAWQKEAEKYYHFIPALFLIPIKTAADMYFYTAKKIANNPLVVLERKIKPEPILIIAKNFENIFIILWKRFFPFTKKR